MLLHNSASWSLSDWLQFYAAFVFYASILFSAYWICTLAKNGPFFTMWRYASAVLGVVILSVRLSIRLFVRLSHPCFVSNPKNLPAIFLYHLWKGNPSSFLPHNSGWWATSPSTFNRQLKWPTPFKNRSRRQISACNVSTVTASKQEGQHPLTGQRTSFIVEVGQNTTTLGMLIPILRKLGAA